MDGKVVPCCRMLALIGLALFPDFAQSQNLDKSSSVLRDLIPLTERNLQLSVESLDISPDLRSALSRAANVDIRVVGGGPTTISDNPWQVALIRGYVPEPDRSLFCGGSIVGSKWILTAAHCVRNSIVRSDPSRINAVAGSSSYRAGGVRLTISKVFVHPSYIDATQENDVALLETTEPIGMGQVIKVISSLGDLAPDARATVSGWGAIFENGPISDDLLAVEIPLVSNEVCSKAMGGGITQSMLCAGEREGGLDSCQGDSGGPLWTYINGAKTQIGVVSWGEGCARRLKYGVYANLAVLQSWVLATVSSN